MHDKEENLSLLIFVIPYSFWTSSIEALLKVIVTSVKIRAKRFRAILFILMILFALFFFLNLMFETIGSADDEVLFIIHNQIATIQYFSIHLFSTRLLGPSLNLFILIFFFRQLLINSCHLEKPHGKKLDNDYKNFYLQLVQH